MDEKKVKQLAIDWDMFFGKIQEKYPNFTINYELSAVSPKGIEVHTTDVNAFADLIQMIKEGEGS